MESRQSQKKLLKAWNLRPSKRLGQHFLINQNAIKKIIQAAGLKPNDTVLEIGPGLGILTKELVKKAGEVIAVEKDPKMCQILEEELKDFKNVKIIQDDILKSNIQYLISNIQYKVVANLPFYLTAPVIRKFLETKTPPKSMVLVVQKEIAQRICSRPPKMSILAVSVQFYAEPKIVGYISKKSFWPIPKVNSAIIKIVPRQFRVPVPRQFCEQFFRIVRAGFAHTRKQLVNNLSGGLKVEKEKIKKWLLKNGVRPEQRAESLSVRDWINLTKTFNNSLD